MQVQQSTDELRSSLEGPRSSAVDLHLMALALRGRRLFVGLFKAEQVDDDGNKLLRKELQQDQR